MRSAAQALSLAMDALEIVDAKDRRRLETEVGGVTASLDYRRRADRLVLVHTEVPDELEGHGVGSALVKAAVDIAEAEGLTVVPRCPFARGWLQRHPDDAARVAIDWKG